MEPSNEEADDWTLWVEARLGQDRKLIYVAIGIGAFGVIIGGTALQTITKVAANIQNLMTAMQAQTELTGQDKMPGTTTNVNKPKVVSSDPVSPPSTQGYDPGPQETPPERMPNATDAEVIGILGLDEPL